MKKNITKTSYKKESYHVSDMGLKIDIEYQDLNNKIDHIDLIFESVFLNNKRIVGFTTITLSDEKTRKFYEMLKNIYENPQPNVPIAAI